jgi:hypothetical protein
MPKSPLQLNSAVLSGVINCAETIPKYFLAQTLPNHWAEKYQELHLRQFDSSKADIPEPKKAKKPEAKPEREVESEESNGKLDTPEVTGRYCVWFIFIG